MKIRIGCDPGKKGGIVAIDENGTLKMHPTPLVNKEIDINKFKYILVDLAGEINEEGNWGNDVAVIIEDVHSIYGSSAGSNFEFGRALGILEGIVSTLDLPCIKVNPKTWQKLMFQGIPVTYKPGKKKLNRKTGKEEITQSVDTKAMALLAAKRLFPYSSFKASDRCKIDHDGIVDSLLMAKYGLIKH